MTKDELNPKLRACYEKYCILSEGQDAIALGYLAAAMSLTEGEVIRQLSFLIANRLFPVGAYINYSTRMLVLKPVQKGGAAKKPQTSAKNTKKPADRAQKPAAENRDRQLQLWQPKKSGQTLLLIGGILSLLIGLGCLQSELDSLAAINFAWLDIGSVWKFLQSAVWFGLGVFQLVRRGILKKREERLLKYRGIIEGEKRLSVKELSKLLNVSEEKVYGDLTIIMDRGLLPACARIDRARGELRLTKDEEPEPEKKKEEENGAGDQYYKIICEIRRLNEEILDEPVSRKIDEIENITAKIFRAVEEDPDKEPQIKSFMSYYLPTTLKLLGTYATLEKQGVKGENIDAAKKDIENILDTLVKGFTQQLDKLFEDDFIDISTDIEVLETMLKKDDLFGERGVQ